MVKGKLTKIKSMLKKSFKLNRSNSSSIAAANNSSDDDETMYPTTRDSYTVYVGKSMRRYFVSSDVVENPVFRELVSSNDGGSVTVGCEVVLFEHLLWMLENADPQPESLDELVEFYAC